MSVEPKPAASDKRTPKDLRNEITGTRSEIDKLLKQSQHTGDLKPVEAALEELQLKTANYRQLIEDMQAAIKAVLANNFLGPSEWKKGFGVNTGAAPPIPEYINEDLLNSECPLHPGGRIKDTHILMLIPKTVDGSPYSAVKLGELCATRKSFRGHVIYAEEERANHWQCEPWAKASPMESTWLLIPKRDPDENKVSLDRHFRGRKIGDLAEVYAHYASHYQEGTALEVMTAVALYYMVSGNRMLADSHLRTKEPSANGGRVLVGCFYKLGFAVFVDHGDHPSSYIGVALARKA